MKHKLIFLFFLMGMTWCTAILAQEGEHFDTLDNASRVVLIEGGMDFSLPLRTYADRVNTFGFGFAGKFLIQTKSESGTFIGMGGYYHSYENAIVNYIDFFDNVQINVADRVATHDIGLECYARHFPGYVFWRFEPYIETSIGVKWIYSTSTSTDVDTNESLNFDFIQNDLAFTYGASVGTQIHIKDTWFVNASIGYYGSTSATYHGRETGLTGIDAIDYFRLNTSLTDVMRINVGVTWAF